MPALVELAATIVSTHCAITELSTDELVRELQLVYHTLNDLQSGGLPTEEPAEPQPQQTARPMSMKKAFQPDQVICMICGRGGMKTLSRHLSRAHGLKPGEYRKKFGIPRTQPLTAKTLSESRRQMATERGLADTLAKAREARVEQPKKAQAAKSGSVKKAVRKQAKHQQA